MTEKQIAEMRKILAADLLKQIRSLEKQVKTVSAERDAYRNSPGLIDMAKTVKCLREKVRTTTIARDRYKAAADRYKKQLVAR